MSAIAVVAGILAIQVVRGLTARLERVVAGDALFATDGVDLFHHPADGTNLRAQPLTGGPVRMIPSPPAAFPIGDVHTYRRDGALFVALYGNQHGIAKWDGAATTTLVEPGAGLIPYRFLVDSTRVYWISQTSVATIATTPLEGGPPRTVAPISPEARDLVGQDDTSVYLEQALPPGAFWRVPKSGGDPVLVLSIERSLVSGGVVSDGYIYYAAWDGPRVLRRVPTSGGPPEQFASQGPVDDWAIAADDCAVYWVVRDPPRLLRKGK